jgi:hypothetical protein
MALPHTRLKNFKQVMDNFRAIDQSFGGYGTNLTGAWSRSGSSLWTPTIKRSGLYMVVYGGSGWANFATPNTSSLDLYVDNVLTGVLTFYFNNPSVHTFLGVQVAATMLLAAGSHTFGMNNGNPGGRTLSSDANDSGFILLLPAA